ncbi:hypothetical protein HD806DRAFT_553010 [Xylariaceae sp. AK1471]|nr:hypothetical protein HD806DRAFT_553010 [Xylariaceae sp. AK1471]
MKSIDLSHFSLLQQQMILNGSALTPPPGVVPNFDHPPNENYLGILTNFICVITTLVVVLLRAYVKIFCMKKVQIEDLAALGTFIGCIYCNMWMIDISGLFVHQWDIRLKDLSRIIYILHIGANLCAVTIMALKASILMEWIRIFVPFGTRNSFFWTSAIVLALHTLFHVAWVFAENLSCTPYRKIWDITVSWGTCINVKGLYVPAAAVNLASDIIILILPQKAIWALQMSKKNKIGVSLMFTIGFLACVAATIRLYETVVFYHSDDLVYAQAGMYLWALAEMTCLFLVFCVPAIPKAFVGRGLKSKVKTMLSWRGLRSSTKTAGDGDSQSSSSVQRVRPLSGRLYRQHEGNPSDDLKKTPSADSEFKGPITEITADGHGPTYQGVAGILCTTQFTAEIITRGADPNAHVESDENKSYERYQWSMMH